MTPSNGFLACLILIGGVALGFVVGKWAYQIAPAAPETYAPAVPMAGGGIIALRDPGAALPAPNVPSALPKGSKAVRQAEIIVSSSNPGCPDVKINQTLVKLPDNSERLVVTANGDTVTQAIDKPLADAVADAVSRPWAVGMAYGGSGNYGVWLDRDLGRIVAGVQLNSRSGGQGEAWARVGVRFDF